MKCPYLSVYRVFTAKNELNTGKNPCFKQLKCGMIISCRKYHKSNEPRYKFLKKGKQYENFK